MLADLLPKSITPYVGLMIMGFFVGGAGHAYKSQVAVAIGIAMIFAATLLLPLAVIATEDSPTPSTPVYAPGTR